MSQLEDLYSSCSVNMSPSLPCLVVENKTGHQRFDIWREQYLLNICFSCKQIANIIGVSLKEKLSSRDTFSLSYYNVHYALYVVIISGFHFMQLTKALGPKCFVL